MKSKNKSEIASAAGVSLRTLRNWLQNPKAQHILQKYGHKQTDRILCPGAVRELCEYFDIQFDWTPPPRSYLFPITRLSLSYHFCDTFCRNSITIAGFWCHPTDFVFGLKYFIWCYRNLIVLSDIIWTPASAGYCTFAVWIITGKTIAISLILKIFVYGKNYHHDARSFDSGQNQ